MIKWLTAGVVMALLLATATSATAATTLRLTFRGPNGETVRLTRALVIFVADSSS